MQTICKHCSREILSESNFCPHCGHSIGAADTEQGDTLATDALPSEQIAKKKRRKALVITLAVCAVVLTSCLFYFFSEGAQARRDYVERLEPFIQRVWLSTDEAGWICHDVLRLWMDAPDSETASRDIGNYYDESKTQESIDALIHEYNDLRKYKERWIDNPPGNFEDIELLNDAFEAYLKLVGLALSPYGMNMFEYGDYTDYRHSANKIYNITVPSRWFPW